MIPDRSVEGQQVPACSPSSRSALLGCCEALCKRLDNDFDSTRSSNSPLCFRSTTRAAEGEPISSFQSSIPSHRTTRLCTAPPDSSSAAPRRAPCTMLVTLAGGRAACLPLQQQQQQPHTPFRAGSWRAVSRGRLQRVRAEERSVAATEAGECVGGQLLQCGPPCNFST